ncbi:MAG: trypsin-like peptidase domain-containing protein, partial [Bacteroidia bacterium]
MNNEIQLESIIEDYLNGKLNPAELAAFEQLRNNDPAVDHKVVSHKVFLESMKQYSDLLSLKSQMDAAHQKIDVSAISAKVKPHSSKIVRIWRSNKSAIAIAASFILMVSAVLLSYTSKTQQEGNLQLLDREVSQLKQSQNNIIRVIRSDAKRANTTPAKFGGTGFAISSNGYILTNYHVIKDADSLYIQNNKGISYKVKKYYFDSANDIAILKVIDPDFENLAALPTRSKKPVRELVKRCILWVIRR